MKIDKLKLLRSRSSRYYCPFCSSIYQFQIERTNGLLICGQCGDLLMKKPLINSKQIIGIITSIAFLSPLLIISVYIIKDMGQEQSPNYFEPSDLIAF